MGCEDSTNFPDCANYQQYSRFFNETGLYNGNIAALMFNFLKFYCDYLFKYGSI